MLAGSRLQLLDQELVEAVCLHLQAIHTPMGIGTSEETSPVWALRH